ncbi:hypothetical protein [Azospirillum sp. TSH100]|uniref:hypothetical protein n=1 Tax=Azospirillum sp. TSH100 TaxID=652764 RepID=UPI0010AA410C|nr:hypothetical protein [Azospirillum sp. TSH100]QCG92189.1 hypothetical protein E6C72_30850 [Azospirillum sp. TSH100]
MVQGDRGVGAGKGRIFWFGAHKLLVGTELARLRALGYEVFNPPYLSHIPDQSVASTWDRNQPTTLPPEVFDKLSKYNFFYNSISPEIADILNSQFDAVVVTIVARWTAEILRVYDGPCIFRAYGQTHLLSDEFELCGVRPLIENRDNFHFCPHSDKTMEAEADWLRSRGTVIPYCLSEDIFQHRGIWAASTDRNDSILVTAPNILGNPFHRAHYDFLKEFFHQKHFKYCGVQLVDIDDDHVVGSLERRKQIGMFADASGYLYTYRDPRVCYLPPVEMIVLGGPVAYLSGSLLARHIGKGGPGEAASVMDAHRIVNAFRAKDHVFIDEVRQSQQHIATLYDPAHVWPIFDREMARMIGGRPASGTRPQPGADGRRRFVRAFIDPAGQHSPAQRIRQIADALSATVIEAPVGDEVRNHLAAVAGTAGPWPALQEAVRLNGGAVDFLERAIGRRSGKQQTVDDLHRDFAPPGSILRLGRWEMDDVLKRQVRVTDQGEAGFLLFGPFATLPEGHYRLEVMGRISATHIPAGCADVSCDGTVLASVTLESTSPQYERFTCDFHVGRSDGKYEFRIFTNGSAALSIERLTVIKLSD